MNQWILSGGTLMIIVGMVHSVPGERLIFSRLRAGGLIPADGDSLLLERHVRILWPTWHLASVFCWAAAFIQGDGRFHQLFAYLTNFGTRLRND
jgi:hypothetical protein